jgi:hypothetical protein
MKVDTADDVSAHGADTNNKHKRAHDGRGPRQAVRKKTNRPPSTNNQQQQQQQGRPQDQPSRCATAKLRLRDEVGWKALPHACGSL